MKLITFIILFLLTTAQIHAQSIEPLIDTLKINLKKCRFQVQ